jgi:hypothetical protein
LVWRPKAGGGRRLFTRLDPNDSKRYRNLVCKVAGVVDRALGPGVYSDRIADATSFAFEPWKRARRRFAQNLSQVVAGNDRVGPVLARADVRNCFPSMRAAGVERALSALGAGRADVAAIRDFLEYLGDHGVPGIPIGPRPSAVLANAVLAVTDAAVSEEGIRAIRWVDDYLIVSSGERQAERALDRLREHLARDGLELAEHKTALTIPRAQDIFDLSFSYVRAWA